MLKENKNKSSFLEGPVWKRIVAQAIPLTIAQLVHLLYNVVDRIYLGHMGEENSLALTGVGLTFPIITLIMAFTALFGNGGVPLFSIARGKGDDKEAEKIMNNSFSLLILSSAILMLVSYIFMEPVLYLFGAGILAGLAEILLLGQLVAGAKQRIYCFLREMKVSGGCFNDDLIHDSISLLKFFQP